MDGEQTQAVNSDGRAKSGRGTARLGLLDVLTALVLLAILLYASWKQFPAYKDRRGSAPIRSERTPAPKP